MALVDILEYLPSGSKIHNTLLTILRHLSPLVIKAADESGPWWEVITQPGREGNYFESSVTAMFIYSTLKGIRKGYLDDHSGELLSGAKKAYEYTINNWVTVNGTVMDWHNTVAVSRLYFTYSLADCVSKVGSLSGKGDYDVSLA